jgi:hypothetical protein
MIATIITSAMTGVVYEPPMTELLTLQLKTLSTGLENNKPNLSAYRGSKEYQVIMIIGTYICFVNLGGGCQKCCTNLVEKTLVGYMNAAATWWEHNGGYPVNLYLPPAHVGQKPRLCPFLGDIVNQCVAWKEQQMKCLPMTIYMYDALAAELMTHLKVDGLPSWVVTLLCLIGQSFFYIWVLASCLEYDQGK